MKNETVIPQVGELLNQLITASGYRPCIVRQGLEDELNALVNQTRPGEYAELFHTIEHAFLDAMSADCGRAWGHVFHNYWYLARRALCRLAKQADTSAITVAEGRLIIANQVTAPLLAMFLRTCNNLCPGMVIDANWWRNPARAWLNLVSEKTGLSGREMMNRLRLHFGADANMLQRWLSGQPMYELSWPYRTRIDILLPSAQSRKNAEQDNELITGWLVVARCFQSLPRERRQLIKRYYAEGHPVGKSPDEAIVSLNQLAARHAPHREELLILQQKIEDLFAKKPLNVTLIESLLNTLYRLLHEEEEVFHLSGKYIYEVLAARLAALRGDQETARHLYEAAVEGSWWRAGKQYYLIWREAFVYAWGTGDKAGVRKYWDKVFLIGGLAMPKRELNGRELIRLENAYRKLFASRMIGGPSLLKTEIELPLAVKQKQSSTPELTLLEAVKNGHLNDVRQLLRAAKDPNEYTVGSGESPLIWALRRALTENDRAILDLILEQPLERRTVNRTALRFDKGSTHTETPLSIAIELGDADVVSRLIELGAQVERVCATQPSALWYALEVVQRLLCRMEVQPPLLPQRESAGRTAKVLKRVLDLLPDTSADNYSDIVRAVTKEARTPIENLRRVIHALLKGGADANRLHCFEPHDSESWTPTVFAARLGDAEIVRLLIDHEGATMMRVMLGRSKVLQLNAMRVALMHGQFAVAKLLRQRESCEGGYV